MSGRFVVIHFQMLLPLSARVGAVIMSNVRSDRDPSRRFIMLRIGTLCLAVALASSTASACLNDSELSDHEREFRSQYLSTEMTSVDEPASAPVQPTVLTMAGCGLVAGAMAMTVFRRR